ncbi:MAG: hypothetical protein JWN68_3249 [Nocardioides sp.]|nr:hypothetical protein [Nocardioides sp.]
MAGDWVGSLVRGAFAATLIARDVHELTATEGDPGSQSAVPGVVHPATTHGPWRAPETAWTTSPPTCRQTSSPERAATWQGARRSLSPESRTGSQLRPTTCCGRWRPAIDAPRLCVWSWRQPRRWPSETSSPASTTDTISSDTSAIVIGPLTCSPCWSTWMTSNRSTTPAGTRAAPRCFAASLTSLRPTPGRETSSSAGRRRVPDPGASRRRRVRPAVRRTPRRRDPGPTHRLPLGTPRAIGLGRGLSGPAPPPADDPARRSPRLRQATQQGARRSPAELGVQNAGGVVRCVRWSDARTSRTSQILSPVLCDEEWQHGSERAAHPGRTDRVEVTSHESDQVTADRQTQTEPVVRAGVSCVLLGE